MGAVHDGPNGVAGEWGHNPLPWQKPEENPGPACYCGKRGCMEMWVSGTGIALDYKEATGRTRTTREIVSDFEAGDGTAAAAVERFEDRLARGLANVINILDPDVIVIGGGVSRVKHIYQALPELLPKYVFGGEATTPIYAAMYGDSSGCARRCMALARSTILRGCRSTNAYVMLVEIGSRFSGPTLPISWVVSRKRSPAGRVKD